MSNKAAPGWAEIFEAMHNAYLGVTNSFNPANTDEIADLYSSCVTASLAICSSLIFQNSLNRENALVIADNIARNLPIQISMKYDCLDEQVKKREDKDAN